MRIAGTKVVPVPVLLLLLLLLLVLLLVIWQILFLHLLR